MFTGHYAPAFVLHKRFPEVALWKLFLAVQAMDVLFFGLVLTGVERMHLDSSRVGSLKMVLDSMPYSHSFVATCAWAGIFALQARSREGAVLAVAAISHWLLDLPMHSPDLAIAPGDSALVGFGLWSWPVLAWLFESLLLTASVVGSPRRLKVLAGALLVIQAVQTFIVPMPTSVPALAVMSEASYFAFAAAAWWVARPAGVTPRDAPPPHPR